VGDLAIVEADKGEDLGKVVLLDPKKVQKKGNEPLKNVLRAASPEDIQKHESNTEKEKAAFKVCRQKIEAASLPMKLVDVEYQLDGNKITFYFTADKRIDFRQLVRELAAEYRVRIELRQIGVRDEAKRCDGYGVCGRRLCCSSFLRSFDPITTQAAKDQNLPLNPQKLSGVCGRLMCCLNYERQFYQEERRKFPALDSVVRTKKGSGRVEKIDVFKKEVCLRYQSGEWERLPLADVTSFLAQKKTPPKK
jgi:cell fate regulator YaaT (PSP1 superfamily)